MKSHELPMYKHHFIEALFHSIHKDLALHPPFYQKTKLISSLSTKKVPDTVALASTISKVAGVVCSTNLDKV